MKLKKCIVCGNEFLAKRIDRKYCTESCVQKNNNKRVFYLAQNKFSDEDVLDILNYIKLKEKA